MANNSVPATDEPMPEIANATHYLKEIWEGSPLAAGMRNRLMLADKVNKGVTVIAAILQRDLVAREEIRVSSTEERPITYPLLSPSNLDSLFIALDVLTDAAERVFEDIRENRHDIAYSLPRAEGNG